MTERAIRSLFRLPACGRHGTGGFLSGVFLNRLKVNSKRFFEALETVIRKVFFLGKSLPFLLEWLSFGFGADPLGSLTGRSFLVRPLEVMYPDKHVL
jgi:hypothetical protein